MSAVAIDAAAHDMAAPFVGVGRGRRGPGLPIDAAAALSAGRTGRGLRDDAGGKGVAEPGGAPGAGGTDCEAALPVPLTLTTQCRARRVLDERTARRLGLDVREAALGVHRVAASTVVRAVEAGSRFLPPGRGRGPLEEMGGG